MIQVIFVLLLLAQVSKGIVCGKSICKSGQECVEIRGVDFCVGSTDECPTKQPKTGTSCNWDGNCLYELSTCCPSGETYDTFECVCTAGRTVCTYSSIDCAAFLCPAAGCDELTCEGEEICVEDETGIGSCMAPCETGCGGQFCGPAGTSSLQFLCAPTCQSECLQYRNCNAVSPGVCEWQTNVGQESDYLNCIEDCADGCESYSESCQEGEICFESATGDPMCVAPPTGAHQQKGVLEPESDPNDGNIDGKHFAAMMNEYFGLMMIIVGAVFIGLIVCLLYKCKETMMRGKGYRSQKIIDDVSEEELDVDMEKQPFADK